MKNTKRYKTAVKLFPDAKISRVASFYKENNTIYIKNYDENVVTIIDGKDLSTLLCLIPSNPKIDYVRYIDGQNRKTDK